MTSITPKVHCYRNITGASYGSIVDLRLNGQPVSVRGTTGLELRNRLTRLDRPRERCLFLPGRCNDPFAALAETIWVLAGRDDVAWLAAYLPRASDYSDDKVVWRAGYGPRLRRWPGGIDQLQRIRDLILGEQSTRRAVMSLFDPALDYVDSKDIPCNNWLHCLVRDNKLHLNVGVRSNDVMWGFSGVDCFEWSVLQDLMAHWCGVEVGEALYLASSFHLYDYHFSRADAIRRNFDGLTCYDFGILPPKLSVPFERFDQMLAEWMRIEDEFRKDPASPCRISDHIADPVFSNALALFRVYLGQKQAQWSDRRIADELSGLPPTDLSAAAAEYFSRRKDSMLADLPEPLSRFLHAYREGVRASADTRSAEKIKKLHAEKNAAYGTAWKKRGELTSILANIARKVDRLEEFKKSGSLLESESVEDTATDLFVYLTKYRLYLLEQESAPKRRWRSRDSRTVLSEDTNCFDELVDEAVAAPAPLSVENGVDQIIRAFEDLHQMTQQSPPSPVGVKLALVERLSQFALAFRNSLEGVSRRTGQRTSS